MHAGLHCVLLFLATNLVISVSDAADQAERFQRGVALCGAIPVDAYETGLIFNPAGHRSYFGRSRCLQELAVEWRAVALCEQVRTRRSLFFTGDAISAAACRQAVSEQLRKDQEQAQAIDPESFHQLVDLAFSQPHYAGDGLMVQIKTRGSHPGSYRIVIEAVLPGATATKVLDDYRQPLGTGPHELTRYIPGEQLRSVLGPLSPGQHLHMRATLTLPPRSHTDHFVLTLTPETDRRSLLETRYAWQ